MWVFYLISLPLTLGMVVVTLRYFAGPAVPRYVVATVGYAWFCSLSIIILVPADIWQTLTASAKGGIGFFWSWSYWSTFILTWAVVPTIQGYEDAGDFTVKERLKTSIHMNLLFYSIVGAIGLIGVILLLIMHRAWDGGIVGFAMACSNTFGLVTGAFLLGFGLSEIPRNIWKNAYWSHRQKVLSHRVAKMAVKLDNAHQEYSNAIVVAQATSNQMSKRDILRPYMDIIDNMLSQMLREDPSFKPSGGRFGENDMDYDTDDKSMATLRRQLRRAHEEYYRGKSEYMTCVMEALKLEDTIKNYERRDASGWKYVSSFRDRRSGTLGPILDTIGCCFCTLDVYVHLHILFIIQDCHLTHCSHAPNLVCRMVARYAPPISYNFLNLIRLGGNAKTTFEKRMGNIDDAVPFFGRGFNKIYPLIMVVYTLLVASNFFGRVIDFLGSWKRFKLQQEEENIDGLDPSGMIIVQKERSWIEQGCKVGEHVIPLARNFNGVNTDIESQNVPLVGNTVEMKVGAASSRNDGRAGQLKYANSRETIASKYTSIREQNRQSGKAVKKEISSNSVSLLEERSSEQWSNTGIPPTGVSATWASMKIGFQNFKANLGSKKFLPLRQDPGFVLNLSVSSPESLDDIFQRLKRRPANVLVDYLDDDDNNNTRDMDVHFQDQ
ncbi:LMBR1-like conserved region family protein isoform X4 [Zea mays]|uniref:LMBR1-like conserved region family protein isoform X4 n=1 Tax=Zea mays TaxID=4577 RepID=UPI0009A9BFF0|nr:LMBR1-like conserved region family protein isoform X4 [Zea mays]|eukprot:XP_020407180.1 LMBR1-like conserved region family protein isoform X4 [Zea mays]